MNLRKWLKNPSKRVRLQVIPKRVGIPALFRGRLRKERLQIESLEASERMGDFQTNRLKKWTPIGRTPARNKPHREIEHESSRIYSSSQNADGSRSV